MKKMIRVSGLLRRVPEAVWFNPQGPGRKKTKQEKRAARREHEAMLLGLRQTRTIEQQIHNVERLTETRKNNRAGERADGPPRVPMPGGKKIATIRTYIKETNKRYPLSEIRAAKAEGRKLKPQTKAAHW